jgi:ketosteroid isomerase-like protein
MPSRKPPPSALGSADETEAQFYEALQQGDIERLMAAWADDEEIVCVHPGGPRLVGIAAVRAAFESMFSHGTIDAHPERVRRLQSPMSAVHSVLERVNLMTPEGPRSAWVIATNVYQKTPQGWRLVAHHASPGLQDEPAEAAQASSVLH